MKIQQSILTNQLELIYSTHTYLDYLQLVENENKAIDERNQHTIDLIDTYHRDKPFSYSKLTRFLAHLPVDLVSLHCRVFETLTELDHYVIDQLWLSHQLNHVLPELIAKKWTILNWSLPFYSQACQAQTRLNFLLNPTAEVGQYLRNTQREFYEQFLRSCQSAPSYRIDCRDLVEPHHQPLNAVTYTLLWGTRPETAQFSTVTPCYPCHK